METELSELSDSENVNKYEKDNPRENGWRQISHEVTKCLWLSYQHDFAETSTKT